MTRMLGFLTIENIKLMSYLASESISDLVSVELVPSGKHLTAEFTFVGQHPGMERALVYLEV